MALTPDQEAEALQLELELRRRAKSAAPVADAADPSPGSPAPAPPAKSLKEQWASATPMQRLTLMASDNPGGKFLNNAAETLKAPVNAAIEGGGAAIGQEVGSIAGVPGMVVGGAIGGSIGNIINQLRSDEPFSGGELARTAIVSAVPGAPLAEAGIKQVAKEAGKYTAANVVGSIFKSEIDSGKLPSAGQLATDVGAGAVSAVAAKSLSSALKPSAESVLYQDRNKVLEALQPEGVVVPPHEVGGGSDLLSSVAGKAAIQQAAAKQNQFVWQKLARQELGLSKEPMPITKGELLSIRSEAGKPYQELQQIADEAKAHISERLATVAEESDPHAAAIMLEAPAMQNSLQLLDKLASVDIAGLKEARFAASSAREQAVKTGDPAAYDAWFKARDLAAKMEDDIETAAASLKEPSLLGRLKQARKTIAQSYAVEDAVNPATGLVNPIEFGKQIDRGDKLTGNLKKIGDFALAFHREAVEAGRVPSPGVNALTMMNAGQQASRGNIPGFIGGVVSATAGKPARAILLSDFVQNRMLSPLEKQNFQAALARYISDSAIEDPAHHEAVATGSPAAAQP